MTKKLEITSISDENDTDSDSEPEPELHSGYAINKKWPNLTHSKGPIYLDPKSDCWPCFKLEKPFNSRSLQLDFAAYAFLSNLIWEAKQKNHHWYQNQHRNMANWLQKGSNQNCWIDFKEIVGNTLILVITMVMVQHEDRQHRNSFQVNNMIWWNVNIIAKVVVARQHTLCVIISFTMEFLHFQQIDFLEPNLYSALKHAPLMRKLRLVLKSDSFEIVHW